MEACGIRDALPIGEVLHFKKILTALVAIGHAVQLCDFSPVFVGFLPPFFPAVSLHLVTGGLKNIFSRTMVIKELEPHRRGKSTPSPKDAP